MADLNSWEDDPAAQDENLSRQTQQQLNMNPQNPAAQGGFRPGAASFQPNAQSFQPGQYGGAGFMPQYQQQQYYQQGYYPQYGAQQQPPQQSQQPQQQQQNFNQYGQYGGGYNQGFNQQGYGKSVLKFLLCFRACH